jgi:hypothetical protein
MVEFIECFKNLYQQIRQTKTSGIILVEWSDLGTRKISFHGGNNNTRLRKINKTKNIARIDIYLYIFIISQFR